MTASGKSEAVGRALVITVSTRASAGVYADRSGPVIAEALTDLGFQVTGPVVIPDGDPVGVALRGAVVDEYAVVITTGGTGINPNDHTPEQTRAVIERDLPQLAARSPVTGWTTGCRPPCSAGAGRDRRPHA